MDILWYGITQWFGRQFAKAITEGPTLEEWQRDLDEKLKQETIALESSTASVDSTMSAIQKTSEDLESILSQLEAQ